jgi:hypothetical protein
MRETETDFKIGDDYQTDHEYHKDDALAEMYSYAKCITVEVEHHINNNCLTLEVNNIDSVHKAISDLKELAYYQYKGDRQNRWNKIYQDEFEYNFKDEVIDLLADELGYQWEEKDV